MAPSALLPAAFGSRWFRLTSVPRFAPLRIDEIGRQQHVGQQLALNARARLVHRRLRRIVGHRAKAQVAQLASRRIEIGRSEEFAGIPFSQDEHRRSGRRVIAVLISPGTFSASWSSLPTRSNRL